MAVVTVRCDDGVDRSAELLRGAGLRVGRGGGHEVDVIASHDRTLSRHAVTVAVTPMGLIEVVSMQSVGSVRVTRADGGVAAILHRGERVLLQHAPLDIVVHTSAGAVVTISLETPLPARAPAPGHDPQHTRPHWMLRDVMTPAPGREWLSVAALAAVLTRQAKRDNPYGQPLRKQLESACEAWFGRESVTKGQLTTWLDQALRAVGLHPVGDKTGLLGDYLLDNGLLGTAELDAMETELADRRAAVPGHGGR
ncbi:MAG: hypothetical protein M3419_09710 [Actinomycetota bacterium]|nr:hypothetical protein [Actinomycetota bacterium]